MEATTCAAETIGTSRPALAGRGAVVGVETAEGRGRRRAAGAAAAPEPVRRAAAAEA